MDKQQLRTRKKRLLLAEGLKRLLQRGYAATGIQEILDVTCTPKGSFYHYFSSKQQFVACVIDYYGQHAAKRWDSFIAQSNHDALNTLIEGYRRVIQEYQQGTDEFASLLASLISVTADPKSAAAKALNKVVQALSSRLRDLIAQGQQQGGIRKDIAPEALAQLCWDTWEGAVLRAKATQDMAPLHNFTDIFLKQIITGAS